MEIDCVLDASALLAWLNTENGAEVVEPLLDASVISTVNLSETIQKSLVGGANVDGLIEDLQALGLQTISFTTEDADAAAKLWPGTRRLGLSLADRACLATSKRLGTVALTADGDWLKIEDEELRVQLIR